MYKKIILIFLLFPVFCFAQDYKKEAEHKLYEEFNKLIPSIDTPTILPYLTSSLMVVLNAKNIFNYENHILIFIINENYIEIKYTWYIPE
jgi:hypothetical protein